jgi:multimeric flavodoxin WrbA
MSKIVIPVSTLSSLQKSDASLKILVLRASSAGRRSMAGSIAERLTEVITNQVKDAEVKKLDLGRMVLASGAQAAWPSPYNDPESDMFVPQDEMPTVYEALVQCDIVIVATDVHWGFPNRHFVCMAERLQAFKTGMDSGQVKMRNKIAAVIATSQYGGANTVASQITQLFSILSFTVPGHCVITAMESEKSDAGTDVNTAGMSLVDAAMALRRT